MQSTTPLNQPRYCENSVFLAIRRPLLLISFFLLSFGFVMTNSWSVRDAAASDNKTYTFTFENVNVQYISEIRIQGRKRMGGGYAGYDVAYRGSNLQLKKTSLITIPLNSRSDIEWFNIFVGCLGMNNGSADRFERAKINLHRDGDPKTNFHIKVKSINNNSKISFESANRWNYAH